MSASKKNLKRLSKAKAKEQVTTSNQALVTNGAIKLAGSAVLLGDIENGSSEITATILESLAESARKI